eukprot:scaffold1357_cov36-Phaeocystis_antarctica.AAC.3
MGARRHRASAAARLEDGGAGGARLAVRARAARARREREPPARNNIFCRYRVKYMRSIIHDVFRARSQAPERQTTKA